MTIPTIKLAGARANPRRNVFRRLFFSMLAFGAVVGFLFPPFTDMLLGVNPGMMQGFIMMCVAAGVMVGAVNFVLFDIVVSREVSRLAAGMEHINTAVASAENSGEECRDDCHLEVTSSDVIGDVTRAFNSMTDAVSRRIHIETTTRRLLGSLADTVELSEVAGATLEGLSLICGGRAGMLYANTGSKLVLVSSFGIDMSENTPKEIDEQHGLVQRALASRSVEWVVPADEGLNWVELSCPLGSFRPESLLIAPLVSDHTRMAGLVVLATTARELGAEQRLLVDSIRTGAAPYVQNAVLHRKLEELAALDELTHLLNRRFGSRRLREEFSRSTRHGVPLSVIMFDVDHFKAVNDTFGHDAGDAVLRAVASVLETGVRSGDVVCRYGGEEFLIVAPGMGLNDASDVATRMQRKMQARAIEWRDQMIRVTISAGAAAWPVTRASAPEELITAADNALYHAKESGRNRVSIHDGEKVVPAIALKAAVDQNA